MHQEVRTRLYGQLCRDPFRGMYGNFVSMGMRLRNSGLYRREVLLSAFLRIGIEDDVPDLYKIGMVRIFRSELLYRLFGRIHGIDRFVRIGKAIEGPGIIPRGDEGAGHVYTGSIVLGSKCITLLQQCQRGPVIDHRRDTGCSIPAQLLFHMLFVPGNFLFVRLVFAQVDPIGPCIETARLKEMDVSVYHARHHPFARGVDDSGAFGELDLSGRPHLQDLAILVDNGLIR